MPVSVGEDVGPGLWCGREPFGGKERIGFYDRRTAANRLYLDGLDLDLLFRTDETETLLMRCLELSAHLRQRAGRDRQGTVRTLVTQMRLRCDRTRLDALKRKFARRLAL